MTRVFLGVGSNLGDRAAYLRLAVGGLGQSNGTTVTAVSDVYETEPVGGPEQGPYLNIVVEVATELGARELLEIAQRLEQEADRVRTERWGPRTLDVDILWVDGETVDQPDLVVPHPRMGLRRFVLAPLSELAADLVPDGWESDAEGEVRRLGPLSEVGP